MRNATIRDIMDIAARKRAVERWYPYLWERVGADSIVTGAVTGAISERVVVTRAEIDQAAAHYEREAGKCWDCKGSGQIQVGYSTATGARHEACARCGGTGEATNKE